jgi:hypothetical protein
MSLSPCDTPSVSAFKYWLIIACGWRADWLPIIPLQDSNTTEGLATTYCHWFSLTQLSPLPKTVIRFGRVCWLHSVMGKHYMSIAAFAQQALAQYAR